MTIDITAIVNSYSEQIVELREENAALKAYVNDLEKALHDTQWERDDYRAIVHDRMLEGDYDATKTWRGWNEDDEEN